MKIKLIYHFLPWEIDYALLTFTQLKKSKYYLPSDVEISIETVLNLSSYLINWEESKLPKEYFIEKYDTISLLLNNYNHNKRIYEGDQLYGHLDLQRECVGSEFDYYLSICPDIYFTEHTLYYLTEAIRNINDKYFVISPQHRKLSDASWDYGTDPDFLNISHEKYNEVDLYDIRNHIKNRKNDTYLELNPNAKFAGWFDIYSKAFFEDLFPVQDEWKGYGPWDYYCLILSQYLKQMGITHSHYILRGQTIGEYYTGPLLEKDGFTGYYKNFLIKNKIPNQREIFESNMDSFILKGIIQLQNKNIIS